MLRNNRAQKWRFREKPMLTASPYGVGRRPSGKALKSRSPSFASGSTCVSAKDNGGCEGRGEQLQYRNISIFKLIDTRPRAVYELEDLKGTPMDGYI